MTELKFDIYFRIKICSPWITLNLNYTEYFYDYEFSICYNMKNILILCN